MHRGHRCLNFEHIRSLQDQGNPRQGVHRGIGWQAITLEQKVLRTTAQGVNRDGNRGVAGISVSNPKRGNHRRVCCGDRVQGSLGRGTGDYIFA